ncbi:MAG: ABC transporter permease [Deltaproteobacteria bacterium]|nr:ABC transporter permease [Deltaproteobacteria bacterium]
MSATSDAAATPGGSPGAPTPEAASRLSSGLRRLMERLMDANPILLKEMLSILRTKLFIRFLYLSTGVLAISVLAGGAAMAAGSMPPATVGQVVFQIFFTLALVVIILVAPAHAATFITSEREGRTYESLLLSGMDAWRIVRGKFLASFASLLLVLVAFAPVVGIAFLFGGISPLHVAFGFMGLLFVLAPCVAFGIALSARLRSTRVAILLALMLSAPMGMFFISSLVGLGEAARGPWGLKMHGPFWFAEALGERFFEWDTFGLVFLLPVFVVSVSVWFFLAAAMAGVRPAAEDRSTPFKVWSLYALMGTLITLFAVMGIIGPGDFDEASAAFGVAAGFLPLFFASLFANEPPLPPRIPPARPRGPLRRLYARTLGPGAAPTTRFAALLIVAAHVGIAFVVIVGGHLFYPLAVHHGRADAAILAFSIGNTAVCLCLLSFGALLRVVLRNGVAARVLAVGALFGALLLPLLITLVVDARSFEHMDRSVPLLMHISPMMPTFLAVGIAKQGGAGRVVEVLTPVIIYGLLGLLFWVLLEQRVRSITLKVEAMRAHRDELLEARRALRPSLAPPEAPVDLPESAPPEAPADPAESGA